VAGKRDIAAMLIYNDHSKFGKVLQQRRAGFRASCQIHDRDTIGVRLPVEIDARARRDTSARDRPAQRAHRRVAWMQRSAIQGNLRHVTLSPCSGRDYLRFVAPDVGMLALAGKRDIAPCSSTMTNSKVGKVLQQH
jgi:hypothetical protein